MTKDFFFSFKDKYVLGTYEYVKSLKSNTNNTLNLIRLSKYIIILKYCCVPCVGRHLYLIFIHQ